ncbi:hypothetical protein TWF730_008981 [Orbilia blumenaviensis]|uniref:Uncharacterized protein n=1 Tax=Orbilia blumenaviensis TaxID=1796055 RepID=A0AAV9V086_9PEZI
MRPRRGLMINPSALVSVGLFVLGPLVRNVSGAWTTRSVDINDINDYDNRNHIRLETLWDALLGLESNIDSHSIGIDGPNLPIGNNQGHDILGQPPTLLSLVASAKAQVKSLINQVPAFRTASRENASPAKVANSQLEMALLGMPEALNPVLGNDANLVLNPGVLEGSPQELDVGQLGIPAAGSNPDLDNALLDIVVESPIQGLELNNVLLYAPEEGENSDSQYEDAQFNIVANIASALDDLYTALSYIEDLKADVQPDFFHRRKEWQIDAFAENAWKALYSYYQRIKTIKGICTQQGCSNTKGLVNWVFNWRSQGAVTPRFQGVVDLRSKQDLEDGNMDLSTAISDAMEMYEHALYKAFEFAFLAESGSANIRRFREELMMIYDYLAGYEGALRLVAASIKILDDEWGQQ